MAINTNFTLIGTIKNVQQKMTKSGQQMATFDVDILKKTQQGDKLETVPGIVAFRNGFKAVQCQGKKCLVIGTLGGNVWNGPEGVKNFVNLNCSEIIELAGAGSKPDNQQTLPQQDDDLPF